MRSVCHPLLLIKFPVSQPGDAYYSISTLSTIHKYISTFLLTWLYYCLFKCLLSSWKLLQRTFTALVIFLSDFSSLSKTIKWSQYKSKTSLYLFPTIVLMTELEGLGPFSQLIWPSFKLLYLIVSMNWFHYSHNKFRQFLMSNDTRYQVFCAMLPMLNVP